MPRKPDLPCADCGELMWSGKTSLPAGQARCLSCRRSNPSPRTRQPRTQVCEGCEQEFNKAAVRRYCSIVCANRTAAKLRGTTRSADDARVTYAARVRDAPGIGYGARRSLRDKWVAQRRKCTYCTDFATTIDHVVPLVRGGTNHEGNLAPACKACNSSKSGRTVIEWRTGRKLPPLSNPLPWTYDRRRMRMPKPPTGEQLAMVICVGCGQLGTRTYCSYDCQKIYARNRYRVRVGIPLDAPLRSRAA